MIIRFLPFFAHRSLILFLGLSLWQVQVTPASARPHRWMGGTTSDRGNPATGGQEVPGGGLRLAGGFSQGYKLTLSGGQYLEVAVEQRGIDEKLPKAIAQDSRRDAAERLFQEGVQLYKQGTAESLRAAIQKWEEALPLWRAVGDRAGEARTLNNIGYVYDALGEKQQALDYYNQALPLSRAVGDRRGEAATLTGIGYVYDALGEKQQALDYYNQALPLSRAVGDRAGEARTLNNIGKVYSALGEKQQALDYYNQALPLSRAVGDRAGEATTLTNIGKVYDDLGEKQQALDYYNQALPLSRAVGDRAGEAATLTSIGRVYSALGEKQQALDYYNQALPLSRAVGDRAGEAATLNNIGKVYSALGEKQQALDYYNLALPLRRAVGDREGEATTLTNIGRVYSDLGEKQQALDYYNLALPLSRAVGDRRGEAATLTNIGKVYSDLGEKQQALDYLNLALPLRRAVGDRAGEAATLNNIGKVYDDLGEKQQALNYLNLALPLIRAVGDRAGEAGTLNNIGKVYDDLGEKQQALDYLNLALPLRRAVGDRAGVANTLTNIGRVYSDLGEKQQALDYLNLALPLSRAVGDRAGEATTLTNIGRVYSDLGEKQQALDYYNLALPLSRAVGDRAGVAVTLYNLAYLKRDSGKLNEALTDMEKAIEIIEDLRTKVASSELRASYFATVQNEYEFYIDLLMQLHKQRPKEGFDAKALEAGERSRARTLLEILTEANADIRSGAEPQLLEEERTLQQRLDAMEKNRIQLLSGEHTEEQAAKIDNELENLLKEYQKLRAKIIASSPRYAALKYPQPLTLSEIQQQVLDDDTLLLEYSVGEERSYLWAVTKTSMTTYELPARAQIEAAAKQFRDAITDPLVSQDSAEVAKAATELSQLILAPVAPILGKKRLAIVADGVLHYIPFAALVGATGLGSPRPNPPSEYVPLIVEHEIVNLPSASTLAISRRQLKGRTPAPKMMLVLADPVFTANDERVTGALVQGGRGGETPPGALVQDLELRTLERSAREADVNFSRLKFTRSEAEAILALVPESQRDRAFDFDASKTAAISKGGVSASLEQYQILHFATHGILNSTHPELSGIVMSLVDKTGQSENGFVRLQDIFNLNLQSELVVLSACKTGTGENIRGEGLVGLTRGFMYAGSARVVASLWSVNDPGTAELMTIFYRKMLEEKLPPAAALREAQIQMLQQEQWRSPYYWAAFTLQGEWR